jgi:hypothetical protein
LTRVASGNRARTYVMLAAERGRPAGKRRLRDA